MSRKNIQRRLAEVYTASDGHIPDLTRLENTSKPWWKTAAALVVGFLVLAAIAGGIGLFIWHNLSGESFTNERVLLKVDAPLGVTSGQETLYTITLTNKEKVDLFNVRIEAKYPDNFAFASSNPEPSDGENRSWTFSVLKPGETKTVELKGTLLAALNSSQDLKISAVFKPSNLNANFRQEANVELLVNSATVTIEVSGPEKTLANQKQDYLVAYSNTGTEDLTDVRVVADFPEGFVMLGSDPVQVENTNNRWDVKELKVDGKGIIKISGDYSAVSDAGTKDFKIRIERKLGDEYITQSEATAITEIIKDQLSLQLIINGSAEDQTVAFGDTLTYSLNYKNTGETELKDVSLTAALNSQIIDWSTLQDAKSGVRTGTTIVWTGKEVPQLATLAPGAEGQLSWQVRLKDSKSLGASVSKFDVENYVEGSVGQTGALSVQSTVRSKTILTHVNSDVSVSADARYYNEDSLPLGSGPIQPQAGETSSYNIRLALTNNLRNVKNVTVTAVLPKDVSWINKETHLLGAVNYNPSSHSVTWTMDQVSPTMKPEAHFNVSIKPTPNDAGKVLVLVSSVSFTATDVATGSQITGLDKALTTAFNDPALGQLPGIVE